MTIERELLKRFMTELKTEEDVVSLFNDIKECLAEPEQTEQEPVAWMYDHQIEVGYDKYTGVNFVETCARNLESNNCINIRPLYLAPPKREPLTPQQISEGNQSMLNVTREAFKQGVIFAEKAHGITGGGE